MSEDLILINDGVPSLEQRLEDEIANLETIMATCKARQEVLKAQLVEEMGAKNILKIDTPKLTITYIGESDTEKFDSKAFRKDHADLYDEYVRMSPRKAYIKTTMKKVNEETEDVGLLPFA